MFCPYLDSNVKNEDSNYDEAFWLTLVQILKKTMVV